MQAGFSRKTVNPPLGMPQQGLWQSHQGGCTRIREDLFVQALGLKQEETCFLVIGADLLFFDRLVVDRFKQQLTEATGVAAEQILITATHNHAGPPTSSWGYQQTPDPESPSEVGSAIVAAATGPFSRLAEATLEAGMTECGLPVSRRKIDAEGQATWAPAPEAEVCRAVPVCVLRDTAGDVISVLYSASCHPSTWYEPEVCGDWPGVANQLLNAQFNTEGALFMQGCAGDTKPCTVAKEGRWQPGTWEDVERAGRMVADAVMVRIEQGLDEHPPSLRNLLTEVPLGLRDVPTEEELEAAANAKGDKRTPWADEMLARLARDGALPTNVPVRLHVLQLAADVRLVALEGEPVAAIGNQILKTWPTGVTFPLGYADGMQIYIPVDAQLDQHGYEVDSFWEYHWPAPLAPGIDATLQEAFDRTKASLD